MKRVLGNESETLRFGASVFYSVKEPLCVYLEGDLGAGKTTFVRGFLRAAGYTGSVKSPTFTLVEEYQFEQWWAVHFDLYRLAEPEELEWMGIRDYIDGKALWFVEWPERGKGFLPDPDIRIQFSVCPEGRWVQVDSLTPGGIALLDRID
ncbi:MAG: tRNA (adenosine(37)-N6)-threonylcarbamoyltransferase complex ATPase subunit type 1 TsaE [Pseudomonadota bacterium]|nr:tRNA (adenosine(37)-N6)-threonylcarbamoyltransferase complex ATPase subunit type 1 TsaE [Pseudomonadota bacterium]